MYLMECVCRGPLDQAGWGNPYVRPPPRCRFHNSPSGCANENCQFAHSCYIDGQTNCGAGWPGRHQGTEQPYA